jgi:hypothetical protein
MIHQPTCQYYLHPRFVQDFLTRPQGGKTCENHAYRAFFVGDYGAPEKQGFLCFYKPMQSCELTLM